ncbi:C-type mannose receptor 2-like [Centroberyx affinis]|uniref:C-type mannose receptor 2-like n=1 Tax=Centroberyx affinis TaxID=166261 RepID=UPI003A5BE22E
MKEKVVLGIFFLSGWHTFSTCLPRQYHYVAEPKNWTEAQSYCREKYTDLATIDNMEEMNQLNTVLSSDHCETAWIGLRDVIDWRWSFSDASYPEGGADYRNWERISSSQPDNHMGRQFCVSIGYDGGWWDDNCTLNHPFICYKGMTDPKFLLVNDRMNWSSAQRYCRENYIDLASVRNQTENEEIQKWISKGWAWIGLYREPQSRWSDGSNSSFTYWEDAPYRGLSNEMCAAANEKSSFKWFASSCDNSYPFVCYSFLVQMKKQVFKLKMKPEDSSVDLNDPAVKANILQKLQDRLKDKGVTGVVLKWREQPDGKVFHKEGKSPEKKGKRWQEKSDL